MLPSEKWQQQKNRVVFSIDKSSLLIRISEMSENKYQTLVNHVNKDPQATYIGCVIADCMIDR